MEKLIILLPAAILLLAHLYCERMRWIWAALATKTGVSLLFLAAAIVQQWTLASYAGAILAGLVLSLWGDVLLAIPGRKSFLAGLVAFLLGHVCYVWAFFSHSSLGVSAAVAALVLAVIALVVYRWLAPHLGSMRGPVIVYMVVISVMVVGAVSLLWQEQWPMTGRLLALVGAVAFFASDLFVARDRFVHRSLWNRVVGLPLYYGGQFMLAYSIGAMAQV